MIATLVTPWVLILQMVTGQIIALDGGFKTKEECETALARLQSGEKMTVYSKEGLASPVERGIGCTPKTIAPGTGV